MNLVLNVVILLGQKEIIGMDFPKGSDKTNGQFGLYPSYKTEEMMNIAKMYTYPEVQVKTDES